MHLSVYMAERKLRDKDVARAVGVATATVNRWKRGQMRPDWRFIELLRVFSNGKITAEDFRFIEPSGPAEPSETAGETPPQPA